MHQPEFVARKRDSEGPLECAEIYGIEFFEVHPLPEDKNGKLSENNHKNG